MLTAKVIGLLSWIAAAAASMVFANVAVAGTPKKLQTIQVTATRFGCGWVDSDGLTVTAEPCNRIWELDAGWWYGGGYGAGRPFGGALLYDPNNHTQTATPSNDKNPPCTNQVADPIEVSQRSRTETLTLFPGHGEMGLAYQLFYVSPVGWTNSLSYWLDLTCHHGSGNPRRVCLSVTYYRPDGSLIIFNGIPGTLGNYPERGGGGLTTLVENANDTYTLHDENADTLTFSPGGALRSIVDASGIGWNVATDSTGRPIRVTHTSGQSYTLAYQVNPGVGGNPASTLVTVTDPAGNAYQYVEQVILGGATFHGPFEVSSVAYPGSPATTVRYYYASVDPRIVELTETGMNGVPFSYGTYDNMYNAVGTRLADGSDDYSIVYTFPSTNEMNATITNPLGHTRINSYKWINEQYMLTSVSDDAVTDCGGTTHTAAYDSNGNLSQTVDNDGVLTTYSYSINGQLQSETEASGTSNARKTNYTWDSNQQLNRLLSVTIEGESKTSYTYNAQNRLASVARTNLTGVGIANQSLITSYYYSLYGNGMVASMTVTASSPNSAYKTIDTYDAYGNVTSVTDALGHTTTYSNYNGLGEVGKVVGPNGDETDYAYDARGRVVIKTTHPNGTTATWTYAYDGFGKLAKITAIDGEVTTWTRDAEMRVTQISHNDKDGTSTETFGYDANSDVTSDVIARGSDIGKSTTYAYDARGRVYQVKGSHGQVLTYAYDGNGNVLSVADALGHVTTYAYDALNRVQGTLDAGGGVTSYSYDAGDNVIKVTDPRLLVTSYSYDGLGQLWQQVSPDTGTTTFAYDAYGRLAGTTRASGNHITYSYDALNRATSVAATNTLGTITRNFTYDGCTNGIGRLCSATHVNDDTVSYSYTPEGRITARNFSFVSGINYSLAYSYDDMGQLASVTYPDGNQALYDYTDGAVADVRLQIGAASSYAATSAVYRPMDLAMSGWTSSNGLSNSIAYDSDLRPTNISAVVSLAFSYDLANHITGITNRFHSSLSQSIGYDAMGQITTIASGVDNESFTYDADGNRTQKVLNGKVLDNTIASDSNRLLVSGSTVWGYDADGNALTVGGSTLFLYSAFGRVTSTNGTWVYSVGAGGQRLREGGPATTYFAPDRSGVLLAEDLNGTWQDYVYLNGRLVSLVKAGQVYTANGDQTGRTLMLTDSAKEVVWMATGLPFTTPITTNTFGAFNFELPGQYEAHGHTHNGYREYNGYLGRYVQSDPLGLAGGINTYAYVGNNPISNVDPYGLWSFSFGAYLGFGGAITFGQDPTTGQFFYGGRVGIGVGIGGTIDPNGERPGAGKDGDNCGHGTTLGLFNQADFTAGVIGGDITHADVGLDLDDPGHGYVDPPAPSNYVSFNRYGFSLGFSTGIEVIGH